MLWGFFFTQRVQHQLQFDGNVFVLAIYNYCFTLIVRNMKTQMEYQIHMNVRKLFQFQFLPNCATFYANKEL